MNDTLTALIGVMEDEFIGKYHKKSYKISVLLPGSTLMTLIIMIEEMVSWVD